MFAPKTEPWPNSVDKIIAAVRALRACKTQRADCIKALSQTTGLDAKEAIALLSRLQLSDRNLYSLCDLRVSPTTDQWRELATGKFQRVLWQWQYGY